MPMKTFEKIIESGRKKSSIKKQSVPSLHVSLTSEGKDFDPVMCRE